MQYHLNTSHAAGLSLENRLSVSGFTNALLLTALPVLSVAYEYHFAQAALTGALIGKWFAFWAIGVRLMLAGCTQLASRRSKSRDVFAAREDSKIVKKATGVADIVLAAMGFLCFEIGEASLLATITLGIYMGLACLQQDFKKPATITGWINMVYDLIVFAVIATCLVF